MARPLRLEFEGAFYHVTSRGNSKQDIYFAPPDYLKFLDILQHVCERHYWRIHAYCLMTNHYHLVLQTPEANLSAGMQQLNGIYTQYINKVYQRCGHIFQGRFKSILVDSDSYYTRLVRYVLQNPVRAQMVRRVEDYRWSSYHLTAGKSATPAWLAVNDLLSHFHSEKAKAKVAFSAFCQLTDEERLWDKLTNQIFLGDEHFTKQQLTKIAVPVTDRNIPNLQRRPPASSLEQYEQNNASRNEAIFAAYQSGAYSITQLAQHFKLHISTISKLLKTMGVRS